MREMQEGRLHSSPNISPSSLSPAARHLIHFLPAELMHCSPTLSLTLGSCITFCLRVLASYLSHSLLPSISLLTLYYPRPFLVFDLQCPTPCSFLIILPTRIYLDLPMIKLVFTRCTFSLACSEIFAFTGLSRLPFPLPSYSTFLSYPLLSFFQLTATLSLHCSLVLSFPFTSQLPVFSPILYFLSF